MENAVVLFDGVCNLCNGSVQWLIRHDKERILRYTPLQGVAAKELLNSQNPEVYPDSILLVHDGRVYSESSAVLKIASLLGFPWNLSCVFYIIPTFVRNVLYRIIARNRYKWFGKKESCMMPDESTRQLFI